jgi:CheY-like chemotaxis protein
LPTYLLLLFSGKDEDKDNEEALKAGENVYLTKPVKPPVLHKQVQDLLASKS